MDFLKIDPRLEEHPDVLEAGFVGSTVFKGILLAVGAFDKRGHLPSKYTPKWLARRLNIQAEDVGMDPVDWVKLGTKKCLAAGLVQEDSEGLVVPGWERFYSPPEPSTDRVRKFRSKQRDETHETDETNETCFKRSTRFGNDETATPQDKTPPTPQDTTPQKQKPDVPSEDFVLKHYAEAMEANNIAALTGEPERLLVRERLAEGSTPYELTLAVDGLTWSDWHMGRNEKTKGKAYAGLKYCLGSHEKVLKFISEIPPHRVRKAVPEPNADSEAP